MVNRIPCYDYRNEIITHFTQWDVNQTITIKDLNIDNAPIFHFYNEDHTESIGVQSILKDGSITVDVPNILLESNLPINVFVYLITKSSGKSIYEFRIPVHSKKKPADYLYIDNIKELIVSGYTLDLLKQELNESITNAENNLTLLDTEKNKVRVLLDELSNKNITSITSSIISGYFGYEGYDDIIGLQVDYENKIFKRLAGAVGLNAGDDFDKFPMYGGMRRCNVSDDGTIVAYYGDDNYADDGSNGQVMVYIPKFYYKVVPLKLDKIENSPGYHIRKANYYITNTPKPGFKTHPAFFNENGKEIDYFLHSAYEGSLYRTAENPPVIYNDAIHTDTVFNGTDLILSRYDTKPIGNEHIKITRANAEKLCSNRGKGWHCQTIKALSALQFLTIIEFGTMNTQAALGYGIGYIQKNYEITNHAAITGSTKSLGNRSGSASMTYYQYYNREQKKTITEQKTDSQSLAISYRGIENLWGNLFKQIQGANTYGNGQMQGGQVYICNDFSFSENKNNENYSPVGFYTISANAYISAFGYGDEKYDWAFIPSEANGTSALPVGDKIYSTDNLNGYRTFIYGGAWNSGIGAGLFYSGIYKTVSNTGIDMGFRLIYLPQG